jgi:hypothetical protein
VADFVFPKSGPTRATVPLLRTKPPTWTEKAELALAERFGVKAKFRDAGSRHVFTDRASELEIFQASDSLRWTRADSAKSEFGSEAEVRPDADIIKAASAFARQVRLLPKGAETGELGETLAMRWSSGKRKEDPESRRITRQVNYRMSAEGLPLMGPGAKAQISVGPAGVVECYRFWRDFEVSGERAVLALEEAQDRFRADPAYSDLAKGVVIIDGIDLGYYALPPREPQGYLIPAFAFHGHIETEALPRYDFTRYVVAVDYKADEVKRLGVYGGSARYVF